MSNFIDPHPSEQSRVATVSAGVDSCEGMAKPAAGDASDSQHGLRCRSDMEADVFTRWSDCKFFSRRASVEVERSEDLSAAIAEKGLNLRPGQLVLVQWKKGGNVLMFRVSVELEEVQL